MSRVPRAGVLRTREFIMKDAYTFDRDREGLDAAYDRHAGAYARMLDRCGLEWYRVEADVGMMGGHGSDEYMAPCAAGENDVVLAGGYAANLEVASADAQPVSLPEGLAAPETVHDPGHDHRRSGRPRARRGRRAPCSRRTRSSSRAAR